MINGLVIPVTCGRLMISFLVPVKRSRIAVAGLIAQANSIRGGSRGGGGGGGSRQTKGDASNPSFYCFPLTVYP